MSHINQASPEPDNQQALTRSTNEVSRRQERLLELRRQRGDDV